MPHGSVSFPFVSLFLCRRQGEWLICLAPRPPTPAAASASCSHSFSGSQTSGLVSQGNGQPPFGVTPKREVVGWGPGGKRSRVDTQCWKEKGRRGQGLRRGTSPPYAIPPARSTIFLQLKDYHCHMLLSLILTMWQLDFITPGQTLFDRADQESLEWVHAMGLGKNGEGLLL